MTKHGKNTIFYLTVIALVGVSVYFLYQRTFVAHDYEVVVEVTE